ncbi:MAG: DUF4292 domain-containing protein [Marinirhabdus sp.]|nr:DUF4292 domain-containing protein [Marinirhabdus sp.]
MKHIMLLLILMGSLVACKGTKNVTGNAKDISLKNLSAAHLQASPDFNTLAARVFVVYEDDEKQQSITISLRMEKDKTIWMKASILGITLAKAKITTDRVQYYETVSNTYFDGDFSLLSDWLGTTIDFQKAQNILLGQSIFNLEALPYTVEPIDDKYKLQPETQPFNFIHSLLLNANNFKIASETLSQPNSNRILTIRYDDYQQIEEELYPSGVQVLASENQSTTKIELTYRKIEPNVSISFPFSIPEGYTEIQL